MTNKYLDKVASLFESWFHTTLHPAAKAVEDKFHTEQPETKEYPANKYLTKIAGLDLGAGTTLNDYGSDIQKNYPEESNRKKRVIGTPVVNDDLKPIRNAAINNANTGALISVLNGTL